MGDGHVGWEGMKPGERFLLWTATIYSTMPSNYLNYFQTALY